MTSMMISMFLMLSGQHILQCFWMFSAKQMASYNVEGAAAMERHLTRVASEAVWAAKSLGPVFF